MKVDSKIKCPGCGFNTKVKFTNPSRFEPRFERCACTECKSELLLKVTKVSNGNQVQIGAAVKTMSKELQAINDEEMLEKIEALNAKRAV